MYEYFLIFFGVVCAINILFYLLFSKFAFAKHQKGNEVSEPVSLIVYIKNQASCLPDFLSQIQEQTTTDYELILVNNASSDNTLDIIEDYATTNSKATVVNVVNNEAFWGSKKYALTLGIKKAKHKILLFTTPNVTIESPNWISELSKFCSDNKELVIGYVNFKKEKGLLNYILRYCRLQTNLYNFGYAAYGKPTIASGSNMGCTSDLFFENNGFSNHMNIQTGTEDLYLRQVATHKNTAIASTQDTHIRVNCSFKDWIIERSNQLKHYTFTTKLRLGLLFLTQVLFWVLAITGGVLFQNPLIYLFISIRLIIVGLIIGKSAFKLSEKNLIYLFPLWEGLSICMQIPIFIRYLFSKSAQV